MVIQQQLIGTAHTCHTNLFLTLSVKIAQLLVEIPGTEKETTVQDAAVLQLSLTILDECLAGCCAIQVVSNTLTVDRQLIAIDSHIGRYYAPVLQFLESGLLQ